MEQKKNDISWFAVLFASIVNKFSDKNKQRIASFIERHFLPVYYFLIGRVPQEGMPPNIVADRLTRDFCSVTWVPRPGFDLETGEDTEVHEEDDAGLDNGPMEFMVLKVEPETKSIGLHDLIVVFHPVNDRTTLMKVSFSKFLIVFAPVDGEELIHFDA